VITALVTLSYTFLLSLVVLLIISIGKAKEQGLPMWTLWYLIGGISLVGVTIGLLQ
jgi:hypothetical protein